MTFQQFIDRAVLQATHGLTPQAAELITSDAVTESLCKEVFREVSEDCASDERLRHMLRRTKTITLTNGIGTIPDDVLTKYMSESSVNDPNDDTKSDRMGYEEWFDFSRPQMQVLNDLGSYSIKGVRQLMWRDPGESYSSTLTMGGAIELNVPCTIEVPVSASTTIDAPEEIIDRLISRMESRLRGTLPKAA